jgi:predicted nicotinamide N-methyase
MALEATLTTDSPRERILEHTDVAQPGLCPEISLYLITPTSVLWRATENDAARRGVPWPFWAFAWSGGQALARYLLDHPDLVRDRAVLDFGTGSGLVAIAAQMCGAAEVVAADIDPTAVEAAALNAELNGVSLDVTGRDLVGDLTRDWDVILAGDMYYDAGESERSSVWLMELASRGARVLIGDPDRGFLDTAEAELLATYDAPSDNDSDGTRTVSTGVYEL